MTISEALISLNSFPIPTLFIEKVGIGRELVVSDDYDSTIAISQSYELATADVYMWLYGQPTLKEQEVSVSQQDEIKKGFLDFANAIYKKHDDPKYTSKGTFGFIGQDWNG